MHRPLVASFVTLPKMEGNTPSFAGHLCVDKLRLQLQREMVSLSPVHSVYHPPQKRTCLPCSVTFIQPNKIVFIIQKEAVSTSHCSQANTIEDEMGIEWRLLQSRSDSWWNRLYKVWNQFMVFQVRISIALLVFYTTF